MSGAEHSAVVHEPQLAAENDPAIALVVVGLSAGGLRPLRTILETLPPRFPGALLVAQHMFAPTLLPELIAYWTRHEVALATSGTTLCEGVVYICPSQAHLIVNADGTLTVSEKERVAYVRPSIDWLLESAAAVYRERATAVLLSGANGDGARGARYIAAGGGLVIVQDPSTCEYPQMPSSVLHAGVLAQSLPPQEIASRLSARLRLVKDESPNAWDPFAEQCVPMMNG